MVPKPMVHSVYWLAEFPPEALQRHVAGDWGELDEEDKKANDGALQTGERLLSAYQSATGTKFWIITEADRSVTTVLLPEDY